MGLILSFCFGGGARRELAYKADEEAASSAPKAYSWDKKDESQSLDFLFDGISDQTIGKKPGQINGQQFIVQNCKASKIYLLDYTGSVNIDDCIDCTILVGPCKGSVFIRDCTGCRILVLCQQLRTRDCVDLDILLFCQTQPIIEESRNMRFGPALLSYPSLQEQMQAASLSEWNNRWSDVHDFTPGEGHFRLVAMENPDEWTDIIPIPDTDAAFAVPDLSLHPQHSLIPLSLGNLPAAKGTPSSHFAFFCSVDEESDVKTLRERCLQFSRILQSEYQVLLVESKELGMAPADSERIFATPKFKENVEKGPVVVGTVRGEGAERAVVEVAKTQSWTHLLHVPDQPQYRLFKTFAEMQQTV